MANTIESILTNQANAINKLSSSNNDFINIGNVYEMVYTGYENNNFHFEMKNNNVKYDFTNKLIIFSIDFNNEQANVVGQTHAPFIININDRNDITYENVFTSIISFISLGSNISVFDTNIKATFGSSTSDNGFEIEMGTAFEDISEAIYSNPKLYVFDFMEGNDNQLLNQNATNILENHYQEIKKIENGVGNPFNTGEYYEMVKQGNNNNIFIPKDTSINFDFSGKILVVITYYKLSSTHYSSQQGEGFNSNWTAFLYTDTWDETTLLLNKPYLGNGNNLFIKKDSEGSFPILDFSTLIPEIEAVQPFLYVFDFSYNNA